MDRQQKDYCVYMHRNKINNKIYIGISCNISVRWYPYQYKSSPYFYYAILKYGWNNFEHIIIEDKLNYNEVNEKEKYYINLYQTKDRNKGYNIKDGGDAGFHWPKEIRNKISKSNQKFAKEHPEQFLQFQEKGHQAARKKVICLNNNKIFNSQLEAAQYAGLNNSTPISRCCRGERKTAGKHPDTKEKLKWAFYNETMEV